MRATRSGWILPALSAVVAVGCGGGSTTAPVTFESRTVATQPTADNPDVQLTEVSVAQWETAIAAQKGKVVLVDVWFYG